MALEATITMTVGDGNTGAGGAMTLTAGKTTRHRRSVVLCHRLQALAQALAVQ